MKLVQLGGEVKKYSDAFESFVGGYDLPIEFFKQPDHFAIKCADEIDYLETCQELATEINGDGMWELSLDNRLLGSAQLAGKLLLGKFAFGWVEIMQPRPGKETNIGFVEHTEFYFPDFFAAEEVLKQRGIDYTHQENPGHAWLNIVIDDQGREIKLNDKPLAEVVEKERDQGLLRQVK